MSTFSHCIVEFIFCFVEFIPRSMDYFHYIIDFPQHLNKIVVASFFILSGVCEVDLCHGHMKGFSVFCLKKK